MYTRSFAAFNTVNMIQIGGIAQQEAEHVLDAVEGQCAHYERLFSHTLAGSNLDCINRAGGETVALHPELAELLNAALGYCAATQGLFDITMGPVVKLWAGASEKPGEDSDAPEGLARNPWHSAEPADAALEKAHAHPACASYSPPTQDALASALTHVNWRQVSIDGTTARLHDPQASLVLGGIAKGYIADKLVALMKEKDARHGLVNLGGNVKAFGGKPDGSPFAIGLREPRPATPGHEQAFAMVQLESGSVVTSGIYERGIAALDGTFYHHILDPRTGMPAQTNLVSATLISDSSLDGDGYTTALIIMGLEQARAFVEALPGCEGVFVTRDGQIAATSGIGSTVPFTLL